MSRQYVILLVIFTASFVCCREKESMPRPRAYPKIEYPERDYVQFASDTCPFKFDYPQYARIEHKKEECWFDLFMPAFAARIHCSFHKVNGREEYEDLVRDAFVIAERINARANYMEESTVKNVHGVDGLILEWSGPAASPLHFFLTDSTSHFFKAALYYDAEVQPDSLMPISDFIKEDIRHLISTFQWTDQK